MHLNVLFVLLCGAVATVHGICEVTKRAAEQETRIFAMGSPGRYQLLRKESVRKGTRLQMLCPGGTRPVVEMTCGANDKFNRRLPMKNCGRISATLKSVNDPNCAFQAYAVGYQVNTQFLELYRTCYDQNGIRALYTTHTAYDYDLVTSRPEMDFTTDGIISGADAATFNRDKVFERFKALLGDGQTYITNDRTTVIARGHLTPSADYLFFSNMRGTFKFVNAVPQFQSINVGNWQRIENWVRRLVETVPSVKVITGARDVLQLRDTNNNLVNMYLAANNKNPIPKWMYKIVDDGTSKYVFLTYNNIWNAPEQFGGTCRQVNCPNGITFVTTAAAGATVCCSPATFRV